MFCQCNNQSYSSVLNLVFFSQFCHVALIFYQSGVFFSGDLAKFELLRPQWQKQVLLLSLKYSIMHSTVIYNLVHVVVIWNSQGFVVRLSTDLMAFTSSSQHLQIRRPNTWASKSKFSRWGTSRCSHHVLFERLNTMEYTKYAERMEQNCDESCSLHWQPSANAVLTTLHVCIWVTKRTFYVLIALVAIVSFRNKFTYAILFLEIKILSTNLSYAWNSYRNIRIIFCGFV